VPDAALTQEAIAVESATDPTRALRANLRGIASVVAPTSLVTALLYYFGWARTSFQARQLGLDDSLLGFSSQDYLLRSLDAMYGPLVVVTLVALGGLALHAFIVTRVVAGASSPDAGVRAGRKQVGRRLTAAFLAAGGAALAVGVVGSRVARPSRAVSMGAPIAITAGIALLAYAAHLNRRLRDPGEVRRATPELKAVALAGSSLVFTLLLLSTFWTVSRYAQIKGIDLAVAVERGLPGLPDATVYSQKRLQLAEPVKEAELAGDDPAYRYSYTGLKFLFRSERRFFLRPSDPAASDVNVIIPDSPEIRVELVKPR